jgi:hypothetical protein
MLWSPCNSVALVRTPKLKLQHDGDDERLLLQRSRALAPSEKQPLLQRRQGPPPLLVHRARHGRMKQSGDKRETQRGRQREAETVERDRERKRQREREQGTKTEEREPGGQKRVIRAREHRTSMSKQMRQPTRTPQISTTGARA